MPFFDNYPYTNLHNVNLDWILQKVKYWGEMVERNDQGFRDLQEAWETFKTWLLQEDAEFKEYVTNYLENLDVQVEINNKLDAMLQSGDLDTAFQPYISPVVTTWMNEHITPTSPVVDTSLTISGAAADSKTVGDKFKSYQYVTNSRRVSLYNLFSCAGYDGNSDFMNAFYIMAGTWGFIKRFVKKITWSDMLINRALSNDYNSQNGNYTFNINSRACYPNFDIECTAGKVYVLIPEWEEPSQGRLSFVSYEGDVMTKVNAHQSITMVDNSGWLLMHDTGGNVLVPTYSSRLRVAFSLANDAALDPNTQYFSELNIYEL